MNLINASNETYAEISKMYLTNILNAKIWMGASGRIWVKLDTVIIYSLATLIRVLR